MARPARHLRRACAARLPASAPGWALTLGAAVLAPWFPPISIAMLAGSLALLVAACSGHGAQQDHARRLEFLHEAGTMLNQAHEISSAARTLLGRAATMFRADLAELVLLPAEGEEVAYRAAVGGDASGCAMTPVALSALDEALVDQFAAAQALLVAAGHSDRVLARVLQTRQLEDAMLVCLRGEHRIIGLMLLGNRTGRVSSFTTADLRLFHALATQVGASLANGGLERSVTRLLTQEQELRHPHRSASVAGVTDISCHGRAGDVLARAEAGARPRSPSRTGLLARVGGGEEIGAATELRSSIAVLRSQAVSGRRCA